LNVLDENVSAEDRSQLEDWGIHVRQIGVDVGRSGMGDDEIISVLHGLQRPTLFTADSDFYKPVLRHAGYCLVYVDTSLGGFPAAVRRLLRHPSFDTEAKRLGNVIRVRPAAVDIWRLHAASEEQLEWPVRR
jgi:hypothetical protein